VAIDSRDADKTAFVKRNRQFRFSVVECGFEKFTQYTPAFDDDGFGQV